MDRERASVQRVLYWCANPPVYYGAEASVREGETGRVLLSFEWEQWEERDNVRVVIPPDRRIHGGDLAIGVRGEGSPVGNGTRDAGIRWVVHERRGERRRPKHRRGVC